MVAVPITISNYNLMDALRAAGVRLPEELVAAHVHVPVDGMMQITYTCNVTPQLARQIGEALMTLATAERLR